MKIAEVPDVRTRIQMAYMEMPEMRLTRGQLRRLLDFAIDDCERALASLTQSGFLIESLDGALIRGVSPSLRDRSGSGLAERRRHESA